MEHEKLTKSFESRYLMPAGYQTEREKFDENFDSRHLIMHKRIWWSPKNSTRVLTSDHPMIRLHGAWYRYFPCRLP